MGRTCGPATPARLWLLLLAALAVLAPACAGVRLVSAYDERSEQELSDLYTQTTAFVDRMISLKGTAEGNFTNNRQFYNDSIARVELVIARSQGFSVMSNCPSTTFVAQLVERNLPPDLRQRLGDVPEGDCQTAVLRLLRDAYGDMRTFHEQQGDRGIPPSARGPLLEGGVGSLLRTAITIQVAKRAAQPAGDG